MTDETDNIENPNRRIFIGGAIRQTAVSAAASSLASPVVTEAPSFTPEDVSHALMLLDTASIDKKALFVDEYHAGCLAANADLGDIDFFNIAGDIIPQIPFSFAQKTIDESVNSSGNGMSSGQIITKLKNPNDNRKFIEAVEYALKDIGENPDGVIATAIKYAEACQEACEPPEDTLDSIMYRLEDDYTEYQTKLANFADNIRAALQNKTLLNHGEIQGLSDRFHLYSSLLDQLYYPENYESTGGVYEQWQQSPTLIDVVQSNDAVFHEVETLIEKHKLDPLSAEFARKLFDTLRISPSHNPLKIPTQSPEKTHNENANHNAQFDPSCAPITLGMPNPDFTAMPSTQTKGHHAQGRLDPPHSQKRST